MVNIVDTIGRACPKCNGPRIFRGDGGASSYFCSRCDIEKPDKIRVADTSGIREEVVERVNAKGFIEKEIRIIGNAEDVKFIDIPTNGTSAAVPVQAESHYTGGLRACGVPLATATPFDLIEAALQKIPFPSDVKVFKKVQKVKQLLSELKESYNG